MYIVYTLQKDHLQLQLREDAPEGSYFISECLIPKKGLLEWLGLSKPTYPVQVAAVQMPTVPEKTEVGSVSPVVKD